MQGILLFFINLFLFFLGFRVVGVVRVYRVIYLDTGHLFFMDYFCAS